VTVAQLPGPLLLITDRQQARKRLLEIIEAACLGGCRWVSVREKDLPAEERLALVQQILPLVHRFGGTLLVHEDVEAARHAHGVHLPAGAHVAPVRERLGNNYLIGLSCHTLAEVMNARGADYVTLGPFAPTPSKRGYMPTFGPEVLKEAATYGVPVLALGGVDETNARELKRAGAAGLAMMGSVMRSENPEVFVRRMLEIWETGT